jgi:hypothetical protein
LCQNALHALIHVNRGCSAELSSQVEEFYEKLGSPAYGKEVNFGGLDFKGIG